MTKVGALENMWVRRVLLDSNITPQVFESVKEVNR